MKRGTARWEDGSLKYGEPVVVPGFPAIMSRERWDDLQKRLTFRGPQTGYERYYPLSGLVHGACGWKYKGTTKRDRGVSFMLCNGKKHGGCDDPWFVASEIEQRVWEAVVRDLAEPRPAARALRPALRPGRRERRCAGRPAGRDRGRPGTAGQGARGAVEREAGPRPDRRAGKAAAGRDCS